MSLVSKIFGTYSQRQIKKIKALADRIDALGETYAAMSNAELRGVTLWGGVIGLLVGISQSLILWFLK